jgi:hypothetical protein
MLMAAQPHKQMQLLLQPLGTGEMFWLTQDIPLYNNGAFHEIDLTQTVINLAKIPFESGYAVFAQSLDLGEGGLTGDDVVHITGGGYRIGGFLEDAGGMLYTT